MSDCVQGSASPALIIEDDGHRKLLEAVDGNADGRQTSKELIDNKDNDDGNCSSFNENGGRMKEKLNNRECISESDELSGSEECNLKKKKNVDQCHNKIYEKGSQKVPNKKIKATSDESDDGSSSESPADECSTVKKKRSVIHSPIKKPGGGRKVLSKIKTKAVSDESNDGSCSESADNEGKGRKITSDEVNFIKKKRNVGQCHNKKNVKGQKKLANKKAKAASDESNDDSSSESVDNEGKVRKSVSQHSSHSRKKHKKGGASSCSSDNIEYESDDGYKKKQRIAGDSKRHSNKRARSVESDDSCSELRKAKNKKQVVRRKTTKVARKKSNSKRKKSRRDESESGPDSEEIDDLINNDARMMVAKAALVNIRKNKQDCISEKRKIDKLEGNKKKEISSIRTELRMQYSKK